MANSTCLSVRLPWAFSRSSLDRISRLFSGVRSSWLMLARNSDLYFEVSASCSAFSSSASLACSTSRFLASTCLFCSDSRCALSSSSALVCCSSSCLVRSSSSDWRSDAACCSSRSLVFFSSSCWACSSEVSSCDCFSRPSVRMLAAMVLSTMPMDSISWSRKDWWVSLNSPKRGQLDHRLDLALEQRRQDDDVQRRGLAQARADLDVVLRHVGQQDARLLVRRTGRSGPRAARNWSARCLRLVEGVAGGEVQRPSWPSSSRSVT